MLARLFFFLFLTKNLSGSEENVVKVNVEKKPRVLAEKNITITDCNMDYYTDDDYIEEGCHRIRMKKETIQEKYGEVRSCCGFHGYLANGICDGSDDKVGEKKVKISH